MTEAPFGHRARGRFFVTDAAVVTVVAVVLIALGLLAGRGDRPGGAPITVVLDTGGLARGGAIPRGFLGLSLEYRAVYSYAGTDPLAVDPVLEQLIRNLTPGERPVLRIGGDSTDWTWWPVAGVSRPPGVTFSLSRNWIQVTRTLATALGARLILGINLEAGSVELAAAEARALLDGIGGGSVQALELGNEPELYGTFAWYRTPDGRAVTGRPSSYDFTAYTHDFDVFGSALPRVPLAGPAVSGPSWTRKLAAFLAAEPRIGLLTLHRYPLQRCFVPRRSARYPSIAHLLSPVASTGLADSLAPYASLAHAHGLSLRIDELNTVSCGASPAISGTFASALWALDALFELARAGIDGVNIHTFPGAGYELFGISRTGGRWRASVAPEYYGLLMFAEATPPGSRLLRLTPADESRVKIWATEAAGGQLRIVLINEDTRARDVRIQVSGTRGTATLERLGAPSAVASTNVTLGGHSFGSQTESGRLGGSPETSPVAAGRAGYVVALPAASAALLTLPQR
jgi:hypothetical protein